MSTMDQQATSPSTWERLAERKNGEEGMLLRGYWIVIVWVPSMRAWIAQLVSPDAAVLRTTEERAKRRPSRTPQDAYRQAARWFPKLNGALPAWISKRSARLSGWDGRTGAVGLLDQRGCWTGILEWDQ